MKHWHLCERWERAGFSNVCPLSGFANHEGSRKRRAEPDQPDPVSKGIEPRVLVGEKPKQKGEDQRRRLERQLEEILSDPRAVPVVEAIGQGVPVFPTGVPVTPPQPVGAGQVPGVPPSGAPARLPRGVVRGLDVPVEARQPTGAAAALNTVVRNVGGVQEADIAHLNMPGTTENVVNDLAERAVTEEFRLGRREVAGFGVAGAAAAAAGYLGLKGSGAPAGGGFLFNATERLKKGLAAPNIEEEETDRAP